MTEVKLQHKSGHLTAYLRGEIDHHAAGGLRDKIDAAVTRTDAKMLTLDFSDIAFMDSSGIGLIMGRYRLMRSRGGNVSVRCASERQWQMMKLAGLDTLHILEKGSENTHENHQ